MVKIGNGGHVPIKRETELVEIKFLNLTPHPVVVANGNLRMKFERDPQAPLARIEIITETKVIQSEVAPGIIIDIPIQEVKRYEVIDLPDPEPGIIYIVSAMVANHIQRHDLVAPITDASCERDERGRVISVKGLQSFTQGMYEERKRVGKTFGTVKV